VHIVGKRRWNRRGAMVTDRYLNVFHHPDMDDLAIWADQAELALIAIDNVPGALPLEPAELPERCVLVFGQEGPGLTAAALTRAHTVYAITQYGSTRSINAAAAAAIAMYHWTLTHAPADNGGLRRAASGGSEGAAAFEGAGEGDLVGVFEVAPDR
jgi:tRNA(Leu) C34 or U34 (ribose-2'-O)-methylase TrmL